MAKKVLITGGLGNLGSWITAHFCDVGYDVYVLTKNNRSLTEKHPFNLLFADISDFKSLEKIDLHQYNFEYVIHTASVNDGFVNNYPELALQVNALGTRNLLEVFKDAKLKHFLYFSTFQVYGKYDGTITEDTPTLPKHDYGTSHLFAEIYLKQFHKTHSIPYTIVRLTNSYGCPKDYDSSKWYLILNDLAKTAYKEHKIVLKSNGKAPRDFIWMGTVAKIVEDIINLPSATNDTFNISGQQTLDMITVAQAVKKAYYEYFNKEIPIETNQNDHTQHPTDLYVSSQKLRNLIEINDQIRFENEAKKIFKMLELETVKS